MFDPNGRLTPPTSGTQLPFESAQASCMEVVGVSEVDIGDTRDGPRQYPILSLIVGQASWAIYVVIIIGKSAGRRLGRDESYGQTS